MDPLTYLQKSAGLTYREARAHLSELDGESTAVLAAELGVTRNAICNYRRRARNKMALAGIADCSPVPEQIVFGDLLPEEGTGSRILDDVVEHRGTADGYAESLLMLQEAFGMSFLEAQAHLAEEWESVGSFMQRNGLDEDAAMELIRSAEEKIS